MGGTWLPALSAWDHGSAVPTWDGAYGMYRKYSVQQVQPVAQPTEVLP